MLNGLISTKNIHETLWKPCLCLIQVVTCFFFRYSYPPTIYITMVLSSVLPLACCLLTRHASNRGSTTTPRSVTTPLFLIHTVMVISPKTVWSHGFVKSPPERPHCVGEIKSFLSHLTWHIPWHSPFGKMNCWIIRICHGILFLPICFRICHGILFL